MSLSLFPTRSDGWNWWLRKNPPSHEERERRWWTFYVEFSGFNGAGGAWIVEKSQWNGETVGSHFKQPRSLSYVETQEMIRAIKLNLVGIKG